MCFHYKKVKKGNYCCFCHKYALLHIHKILYHSSMYSIKKNCSWFLAFLLMLCSYSPGGMSVLRTLTVNVETFAVTAIYVSELDPALQLNTLALCVLRWPCVTYIDLMSLAALMSGQRHWRWSNIGPSGPTIGSTYCASWGGFTQQTWYTDPLRRSKLDPFLRRWPNIEPTLCQYIVFGWQLHPRKHEPLSQCCFNVEPTSKTVAQH